MLEKRTYNTRNNKQTVKRALIYRPIEPPSPNSIEGLKKAINEYIKNHDTFKASKKHQGGLFWVFQYTMAPHSAWYGPPDLRLFSDHL